ncbi:putative transporter putative major facilitator superfamily protein (MFS) [Leptomonas seymouri]|uniref:Putative transporter putative major facilitator superfamily protein (MFS) n=1 Tax=Leptomonas seymouri TaxID=5684 RepID=A0A0N1HVT4_LEPSE|nr:putative transporter putative major facilitator superfamily protein (MFS) [Leptomonas seymouri]|eukprot:KPI85952.1 putative transporter putative major facilitator superfamily protein (MFS) [Leptomonas seymouri]
MSTNDDVGETVPMIHGQTGEESSAGTSPNEEHHWVSPRVVLVTFTTLNFLLYFDRGATAGALSSIRADHRIAGGDDVLSDAKSGLLVSGFTIGYLFTSPLFVSRGGAWGSKAVILLGMFLWCVTCLGCAAATSYGLLLLCRILVGVGEAAFVGFTVTIIDSIAPPTRRTSWIGFFYSMIPVGTAVGMGCGGVLTSYPSILGVTPWRLIFLCQVVAALPIIALLCSIPSRYHLAPAGNDATPITFVAATVLVLSNANYVLLVFGFSTYCFVTGAVSTWGIPLLHEGRLQLSKAAAAAFMGLATTLSGVVGSLLGGFVVDRLGGSVGITGAIQCQKFNVAMILISIPCGAAALLATDVVRFAVAFVVAVVALFAITAPVNASILTVVPPQLRPYAVSYSVFFIHLLGDFPSPMLAGLVSDYLGRHCRGLPQERCAWEAARFQCVWVTDAAAGRCTNKLQLRNALLLVFTYLLIAPPCWGAVWWRLRRKDANAGRAEDVVVEGVAPPPPLLSEERVASPPPLVVTDVGNDKKYS